MSKNCIRAIALSIVLIISMLMCSCAASVAEAPVQQASVGSSDTVTYTGVGSGNNGDITVSVSLKDGTISQVEVINHSETAGICDPALESIPAAIVAQNSTDVDTISGATHTSDGIISAVEDALSQAGIVQTTHDEWRTFKGVGGREIYESQELLDAAWKERENRDIQAALDYAPKVITLENGVQVQAVPYDSRHWNTAILNAEERGCNACHDIKDALENLPRAHPTLYPAYNTKVNIDNCLNCHDNIYGSRGTSISIQDAMHSLHMGNEKFDGSCFSCHHMYDDGTYALWDHVKYSILSGITKIANVEGEFSFDQNVITPYYDTFMMASSRTDPNGVRPFSHNNQEIFDNWTIEISGLVDNPYTIKLSEVKEEDMVTRILKQNCLIAGMGVAMISNCEVTGLDCAEIMEKAGVQPEANVIRFINWDGSHSSMPLDLFKSCDKAMLAFYLNGEHLPSWYGYPVQCWMGDMTAEQYAREIQGIEFIHVEDMENYSHIRYKPNEINGTEHRHDSTQYVNNPNHAVLNVQDGQIFEWGSPITFEGYADAYMDNIKTIEFSMDYGATWTVFETPDVTNDRWVYWYFTFNPPEVGSYVLTMRCTTDTGNVSYLNQHLLFHVQ